MLERIARQLPVPWADTWPLGHFSILGDVVGTHERGTGSAILTPRFQEKVNPQSEQFLLQLHLQPRSQMSSTPKLSQVIIITEFSSLHVTV